MNDATYSDQLSDIDMELMISYSRRDAAEVDSILTDLKLYGLQTWKDTSNMQPGEDWRSTLLKKPTTVDGFIPFLSANYVESDMCRMELFLARATDRQIFPIMLTECWEKLDTEEETKHISALFAARMEPLKIVSLPVTRKQMLERFARDVERKTMDTPKNETNVYISYPDQMGLFATQIRNQIATDEIKPWIATLDCEFGSDWRKSQVDAMKSAKVHVIVVSEDFLDRPVDVLRTEVLMSESLGIEILGVETPDLQDGNLRAQVYDRLASNDVFRRVTRLNWYKEAELGKLKDDIYSLIPKPKKGLRRILPFH